MSVIGQDKVKTDFKTMVLINSFQYKSQICQKIIGQCWKTEKA